MRAAFPLSIARLASFPLPPWSPMLRATTTALVCTRKKQRCIYSGQGGEGCWGEQEARPISLFRGCAIEPNAAAKVAAQVPQTADGNGLWCGFLGHLSWRGRVLQGGTSGVWDGVTLTAAHLKFQKVTSHPWHIRSICRRGQRTADSGRTCHSPLSSPAPTIRQRSQF